MNKHIRFVGLIIIAFSLALISSNAWANEVELSIEKEHKPAAICYHGGAYFYNTPYFCGNRFYLKSGFGDSMLITRTRGHDHENKNWYRQIESLKIKPCTEVIIYGGDNFHGYNKEFKNTKHDEWMEIKQRELNIGIRSIKVLPCCETDLCAYTEEELAQLDEDKNRRLFDLVYALSGEWWLSKRGKNYQIEITTKKNSSEFTARYMKINNPSTFSGNVWFDSNDTPNIKFTQYDSSTQFTATYIGKQVKNDRFEGDFSSNRGHHGVSFALWRQILVPSNSLPALK